MLFTPYNYLILFRFLSTLVQSPYGKPEQYFEPSWRRSRKLFQCHFASDYSDLAIFRIRHLDDFRNAFLDEMASHLYTRGNNPTVAILRQKLAALENAEDALVFGSGCAAIAAAIMSNAKSGDHVVCVQHPYSWTYKILKDYLSKYGRDAYFC